MKKISQLTTTTTLADTDVIPVVTGMTGTPVGKKIAVSNLKTAVNYHTHANTTALNAVTGVNTGDQNLSGYEPLKGADDNFVTDAEKTKLANLSGTNTGDQTLPVKATGAEVTTGTDDAKFVTAKALADAGISASGSANGWTTSSDTWTYASASTFTIAGVDRTTTFTKGTRLKFTQTTAKYAVVVASSFSTDTTVTIAVSTDYTIANAAITSPYYSYQASPQGYPTWFNYTPTFTGFSANPASYYAKFSVLGTTCTTFFRTIADGTSNATGFEITAPVTAATIASMYWQVPCLARDNGLNANNSDVYIGSAGTAFAIEKDFNSGTFTASGGKGAFFQIAYEI